MNTRLKKVCNAREWAENAGYKYDFLALPEVVGTCSKNTSAIYACQNILSAHEIESKTEREGPILIDATNVSLVVWNWTNTSEAYNYKYFVISNAGELLCEPPNHSDVWHKYFSIFKNESPTYVEIPEPLLRQAENLYYDDAMIFCCGSSHFGHWMSDTLPLIAYAVFGENTPLNLMVTPFNPYQADVINTFETQKRRPIHGKSKYTHINIGSKKLQVLKIPRLKVFGGLSTRQKTHLLRYYLTEAGVLQPSAAVDARNLYYLYRGKVNGISRLENEDQLVACLAKLSIKSVDSAKLKFSEAAKEFSKGSLFISSFGSGNTHFNLFSQLQSRLIQLLPMSYQHFTMEKCLGSAVYMLPRADRTKFLFCRQLDTSSDSEHTVTHADPSIIQEVIRICHSQSSSDA